MFEFGFEFEFELDFELDLDFEPKVQVKVFGAFFIRYGAYTYNCMRYPSRTVSSTIYREQWSSKPKN